MFREDEIPCFFEQQVSSFDMDDDEVKHLPWTGERLVPTYRGQGLYEHLHRYALAVAIANGKRVLDIACGEGYGSNLLAAVSAQVIGVDIDAEVVAHAKRAYQKENLIFREGSCLKIPVEDHSIDLVVSFETIEHIDEHAEFLREIKRVLAPEGALLISSPDKREYTDRTGTTNPFHKSELYHDDFHRLLKQYFKKCRVGKQRLIAGSWIAPDASSPTDVFGTFNGEIKYVNFQPGVSNGVFSIAVCSDTRLPRLKLGVFENRMESETTWAAFDRSVSAPVFQVFSAQREGFKEESSVMAPLQPNVWQTLKLEQLQSLPTDCSDNLLRYRIDPVDRPASIAISRIFLIAESDGAILYSAMRLADFEQIECSAGLLKYADEEG
ncbi:MAG: methyltransferase domain-containing protein, partial [Chthoniobacterales bacterium]|nr:methyltransferase domain-containing protein [Chthoniobacterales bacterium]